MKKTNTYLFSYYHDGAWWVLELQAYDQSDATERLNKLPLAKYDGELMLKIPIAPHWAVRAIGELKGFIHSLVSVLSSKNAK